MRITFLIIAFYLLALGTVTHEHLPGMASVQAGTVRTPPPKSVKSRSKTKKSDKPTAKTTAKKKTNPAKQPGKPRKPKNAARSKASTGDKKELSAKKKSKVRKELDRLNATKKNKSTIPSIFKRSRLDPHTKQAFHLFESGQYGQSAKKLAPRIANMSKREFLSLMRSEVKSGRAQVREKRIQVERPGGPKTTKMKVWEYKDGSVIRYKPSGDFKRNYPTYSVEVKKNSKVTDKKSGQSGIAFKLNSTARPMPKGPQDMRAGTSKKTIDKIMNSVHLRFSK